MEAEHPQRKSAEDTVESGKFVLDLTDRSTIITPMNPPLDTLDRILKSASELMYSRSYADVGVAAICEHAGVKKGSFYHFFPSKRDLTLAVLDKSYIDMKENMLDAVFASDIPPLERLLRFAETAYEFNKAVAQDTGQVLGCPFGNLAIELSTQEEAIRLKLERIFKKLNANIRQVLQDAVDAGDLKDINIDATAQAMIAYFEGCTLLAKVHNDVEVLRTLLPQVAQIRIPAQQL